MSVTFIFRHFFSPSGYYVSVETDGLKEEVDSPFNYAKGVIPCDSFVCVTLSRGQHIFVDEYPRDDAERQYLVTVPEDETQFEEFRKAAEQNAGLAVYERILGYKTKKGELRPTERPKYDYTEDFDGGWLAPFITRTWNGIGDSNPQSLVEAT